MRKNPHVKVKVTRQMVDPYRGRSMKASHAIERSGYARGGAVDLGTVKDSYLRGKSSPWSAAHDVKKK